MFFSRSGEELCVARGPLIHLHSLPLGDGECM